MPAFKFTVTSINGRTIVGGSILASYFLTANGPLKSRTNKAISASRTSKPDALVRFQPQPDYWRLRVLLSGLNQTDLAALRTMFNESEGAVYLRVTDGASIVWRTVVQVESSEPAIGVIGYDVVLFVPDPTWEEDTQNTTGATDTNKTASPISMNGGTMNNNGERDTEPAVAITANVAKSANSALNDFPFSFRTFWVNRTIYDLVNEPVYLADQTAAQARFATDTSAGTGAFVNQNSGTSQTLTADPGAGGTTLAMSAVAGFNTNGGLAIIDWVTGSTFGTMEAVYYTGVSGNNLTGVVRGIGGTTAQAHAIGKVVRPSGTMPNGDDVRVWFEDQPNYRRDLVAWNSTLSDIVINVTAKKVVSRTLVTAMASSSVPAVGAVVNFVEGNAGLDAQGFFACGNEIFHYSAKSGDQGVVLDGARGLWQTTAAAHTTAALCYFNPKRIVVASGWAKADSPPADLAHRACIQLPGSSNQTQKWGDETDDPLTRFFDRNYPSRPKQWSPGRDLDGNSVAPNTALSKSDTIVTFKSDVPGDGNPPYNTLELFLPQGLRAGSTSFQNDWTPSAEELNLEAFLRDANGVRKLIDALPFTLTGTYSSAAAAARQSTPTVTNYGVILKARYNIATGFRGDDSTTRVINNATNDITANGVVGCKFTLSKDTRIRGFQARLKKSSAGSQVVQAQLYDATGTNGTPGSVLGYLGNVTVSGTTQTTYTWIVNQRALTKAGTYWILLFKPDASALDVEWSRVAGNSATMPQQSGDTVNSVLKTGGVWQLQTGEDLWFNMVVDYDNTGNAFVEADQPIIVPATSLRTGVAASFDKASYVLEPLQTVYVHRNTAFVTNGGAGAMLHVWETIASATSGDSVALDKWMPANAVLTIDFALKTVSYTEDGVVYPLLRLVAAKPQMLLKPGANTLTITDASLISPGQVSHVTTWRGKRT